jgi:TetR/AcrR family transcriptional repressor of nem operon
MDMHRIEADWTPVSLAAHTQAVLQGAFILEGDRRRRDRARDDHLRRYIELLLAAPAASAGNHEREDAS